jgi:hypothetical protein
MGKEREILCSFSLIRWGFQKEILMGKKKEILYLLAPHLVLGFLLVQQMVPDWVLERVRDLGVQMAKSWVRTLDSRMALMKASLTVVSMGMLMV